MAAGALGGLQVDNSLDALGAHDKALGTGLGMAAARPADASIHLPRLPWHILDGQLGGMSAFLC